ncbi:amidohydrolase family protein [Sphingomonas oligophenolica]|uniref:Amidohydrolase family protein n=1 Tax=Sphingomonas oligophenolica TaxID=301154 RepID=A0ABU9XWV2_9SPHN
MIRKLVCGWPLVVAGLMTCPPAHAQTFAIVNAHILSPGPVGEVAHGTIVVRDGVIIAAGANVAAPPSTRVIDAKGARVTPGFVAVNTALGLMEVSSVDGTMDGRSRSPQISAAFDVRYGLNPESTLLPVARLGGVTRAVVMPDFDDSDKQRELPFAGQAAMITLDGGSNILFKPSIGMVIELGEDGGARAGGSRAAEFVQLRTIFDNVRLYRTRKQAYDNAALRELGLSRADLEALIPVVEGRMPLIATVHRAADIRQTLQLARDYHLKLILNGAEEGWRVAREIAGQKVPVLLNPTANIPRSFDLLGATLRNAALLNAAGVDIAISGNDSGHAVRDMRYNAGLAVSHGLPYDAAIRAITLGPSCIFGTDDHIGSIAPGKEADLVIWDGDPLEPLTQPVAIFVDGKEVPLTSRALELRDRYLGASH